jgi:hypothetical protein
MDYDMSLKIIERIHDENSVLKKGSRLNNEKAKPEKKNNRI